MSTEQTTTWDPFVPCDNRELVRQIQAGNPWNLGAISGGRVLSRETGVTLPVGSGYSVTVDLAADDTYTVRRVFTRGGKRFVHGERAGVYCDEVGEVAYMASCFRSHPQWSRPGWGE